MCIAGSSQTDPRVPDEVRYKSGYINSVPKPAEFNSAMLWGIAIADTRVPGYERTQVEIANTQLSCRVSGENRDENKDEDIHLNDDCCDIRGGLYRRHDPISLAYSKEHTVILRVGTRPDRVWHFWAASPRTTLPAGHLEGCTVKVRAKISRGVLLQIGMDYWRNPTIGYGSGGNNHEAGASNWYFSSDQWQEAVFTDVEKK
jgi:hypothetical protein